MSNATDPFAGAPSAQTETLPRRDSLRAIPCRLRPAICGCQSQIVVGGVVGYDFGPMAV
jgi:hypothetical protein